MQSRSFITGLFIPAVALAGLAGCIPPEVYREKADQVAYREVENARRAALQAKEPFTIQRPADTLRQRLLLGQELPISVPASLGTDHMVPIEAWPDEDYLEEAPEVAPDHAPPFPLQLSLMESLQVAAFNNRDYQLEKEQVYLAALALDLERDQFRFTWAGSMDSLFSSELGREVVIDDEGNTEAQPIRGLEHNTALEVARRFKNGMTLTGLIGLDLVKLLTQDRTYSRGVFMDGTISIPLLRGADRLVVTEPLTQAERDMVYAIYQLERFKRVLAVDVSSGYLAVLEQLDRLQNAEANYRRLIASTRRARRLAEAGLLPEIQVDQARQDELRASNRWILARESYRRELDSFKLLLGLPTDAEVALDETVLDELNVLGKLDLESTTAPAGEEDPTIGEVPPADEMDLPPADAAAPPAAEPPPPAEEMADVGLDAPIELVPPARTGGGPWELEEDQALVTALENRLDLRVVIGRVDDAQRKVVVAADALKADLTLLGSGSIGEARTLGASNQPDANLRFNQGRYNVALGFDPPLERTAERNLYRSSLIAMEQAVRDLQQFEDQVKFQIRNNLRALLEARETIRIQTEAVSVAESRVISTDLFLQAGRAEVRDVLEAQEALISAQNALTSALVQYRVAEWEMQRDLGTLQVSHDGLWQLLRPEEENNDES